eukprot:11109446-Alexandrium_andersonii.AAC.1
MSASLVGSEMCIRDRDCRITDYSRTREDLYQAREPWESLGRALEERWGCLLYTSDAADDM